MSALVVTTTLWLFFTPIAALATTIAAFILLTRRHRVDKTAEGDAQVSGNGVVRLLASMAFGYAAGALVTAGTAIATVAGALSSRGAGPINFDIGTVKLPLFWNEATELGDGLVLDRIVDGFEFTPGYFSEIALVAPPISNGTAMLYFAPLMISPILHLIVAIGIGMLAASIDRRAAFAPGLIRVVTFVGLSLLLLGLASEVLGAIGTDRAADELLINSPLTATSGFGELDLTVVAAALAVLLISALTKRGLALQRDTVGLV